MKKIFALLFGLLTLCLAAQTPTGFNYQAVLRNSSGEVLANQSATLRISITNSDGSTVHYSETHAVSSNAQGIIAMVIGTGTNKTGNLSTVPWGTQSVYLYLEIMLSGASSYTPMGLQQLQSVPYALYAADGVTIQWLGSLTNAPISPAKNQAYYNSTDKISYIWDGDSWETLCVDGATGPQGDVGPVGPQGETGLQGIQGIQGATGTQGAQGAQGATGPQGPQGLQGATGPQGPQGPAGIGLNLRGSWSADSTYIEGDYVFNASSTNVLVNSMWICQAPVGPSSTQPKDDLTNWVEFEAPQGPEGPQGPQGPAGPQGLTGPQGLAGAEGSIGPQGITGEQGPTGPQGSIGPQGLSGENGISLIWKGTSATEIVSPQLNWAYYNSSDKKSYVWDGDSWEIIAMDGAEGETGPIVSGANGQMLVHDGTNWTATSAITLKSDTLGIGLNAPVSRLIVKGDASALPEDPIFEVKNKDGKVVLGVYNEGVRVYVDDSGTKGAKGGFAVGGLSTQGKGEVEYLRITPDSARIYIDTNSVKGAKGGFAVGGLSTQGKALPYELLRVTKDSTRVYVADAVSKGAKGGFAVGGLSTQGKTSPYDLLRVTKDSTRVYVNENPTKGAKGGFAVGGLSTQGKTTASQFMNITPDNYFIGHQAGDSINGGLYNSFMGYQSGKANTTGSSNVFLGYLSGRMNQTGGSNVVVGNLAGYLGTTGSSNVFLGDSAGFGNTNSYNVFLGKGSGMANTGQYNSFMGYHAGLSNISGSNNVFIGNEAGLSNESGEFNVFLGYRAGYSSIYSYNTFLGYQAGYENYDGTYNSFLGYNAGYNNSNGSFNCFWGPEAGFSNESGSSNIFVGNKAGYSSTTGSNNILLGYKTGFNNTGSYNIMLGNESGYSNTSGEYNVFMGFQSGNQNDDGTSNTFIGYQSGYSNTSAGYNTFIGYQSGLNFTTGQYNTFIGYQTGLASETSKGTGKNNVAIGYKAGISLTYGENNIFIGTEAGGSTTGVMIDTVRGENTFVGYWAGKNNTTGYQNIAIGYLAGMRLSSNNRNTLVGTSAGQDLSSGLANSYFGTYAGRLTTSGNNNTFVGYDCGYQCYTGSYNTFVGFQAGRGWGTTAIGDSSVFIGNQAGVNESGSNLLYISNSGTATPLIWGNFKLGYATVHGKLGVNTKAPTHKLDLRGEMRITQGNSYDVWIQGGAATSGDNRNLAILGKAENNGDQLFINYDGEYALGTVIPGYVGIGSTTNNSSYKLLVYGNAGGTSWTNTSDIRWKKNIIPLGKVLSKIKELNAVKYEWKVDEFPKMNFDKRVHIGLIAQDLENVFPELVFTDVEGYKSVAYDKITAILIEGIKEQQVQLDSLREENVFLKEKVKEIDTLKAELEAIKALLKK